ncbi:MAG TPA: hypothetical protein VGK94_12865 [Candidatus Polarisedimenticolia bacterium]|jgi:hypothetical protein
MRFFRIERGDRIWIALLIGINLIVLLNALLHDPRVGYDAPEHLRYVETLSRFRLPMRSDTLEFFSPPLPYLAPALLRASGAFTLWGAAKAAQLLNVLFSVALTLYLVKICDRLRPGDPRLKAASLMCLGMLPVYYKTFAFVRGEPLLACLSVLLAHRALALLLDEGPVLRGAVPLGLILGLIALTRQWGFFLFGALSGFAALLILSRRGFWRRAVPVIAASFLIAGMVGGWFYLHLRETTGSMRAFNRPASSRFSTANLPAEFYFDLGLDKVFVDPVRPLLGNRILPILYSEMWGDYWTTFVLRGTDTRDGNVLSGGELYEALSRDPVPAWLETNRWSIAPYLGRVNMVSLAPTALLMTGLTFGAASLLGNLSRRAGPQPGGEGRSDQMAIRSLLFMMVAATALGYGWFLIMYPRPDTIKASYVLQAFPALAILGGDFLQQVRQRSVTVYRALIGATGLALLHNAPVLLTRYWTMW